jgi:hypothetical protein
MSATTQFWKKFNAITRELQMGLLTTEEAQRESRKIEQAFERKTGRPAPTRPLSP